MDPLPGLGKVHGLLIAEEHTKNPQPIITTQPIQEDSAMVSHRFQTQHNQPKINSGQHRNPPGPRFFPPPQQSPSRRQPQQFPSPANPPRQLHHAQPDTSSRPNKDPNAHCTHCNRAGHYKSGCFKLIGYPEWFFNRLPNQSSAQSNYAAQTSDMDFTPRLSPAEASQAYGFYDNPSAFFTGPQIEDCDWSG
ncbi:uncharacterized protein LOC131302890 [Rhododendron vialii]|uniref:uncharacterized protein LOC131302890 n=1 Tax=Rhododendron vialii TaxID=182163 RepID=UPI00265F1B81|nr:uncharacterized protein LOC131302890 [Rhododendron vialii]